MIVESLLKALKKIMFCILPIINYNLVIFNIIFKKNKLKSLNLF